MPEMTRREAALILGLRESAPQERVREAHRRIMIANHPDAGRRTSGENWRALASLSQNNVLTAPPSLSPHNTGGSSYLATKVNEAKELLLGKAKRGGSAF